MGSDDMRTAICNKIDKYSRERFTDQGLEDKQRITAAITMLFKHVPEEGYRQMLLTMAQSDQYVK